MEGCGGPYNKHLMAGTDAVPPRPLIGFGPFKRRDKYTVMNIFARQNIRHKSEQLRIQEEERRAAEERAKRKQQDEETRRLKEEVERWEVQEMVRRMREEQEKQERERREKEEEQRREREREDSERRKQAEAPPVMASSGAQTQEAKEAPPIRRTVARPTVSQLSKALQLELSNMDMIEEAYTHLRLLTRDKELRAEKEARERAAAVLAREEMLRLSEEREAAQTQLDRERAEHPLMVARAITKAVQESVQAARQDYEKEQQDKEAAKPPPPPPPPVRKDVDVQTYYSENAAVQISLGNDFAAQTSPRALVTEETQADMVTDSEVQTIQLLPQGYPTLTEAAHTQYASAIHETADDVPHQWAWPSADFQAQADVEQPPAEPLQQVQPETEVAAQPATEAETAPEAQPPPQQEETEYASDFETSSAATSKANLHVTWAEDAAQENIEVAPQENIEVAPEENIVVDQEQPQQQAPVAMAESDPEEQYAEPENTSAAPQEDIQSYADDFEAPPAEDIQVDHESTPAVDIDATTGVATEYEIVEEDQQQQPAVSEVMSEAQPEEGVQEDIYAVPEDTHAEIAEDISGAAVSVPAAMTEEISDHLGYAAEQSKTAGVDTEYAESFVQEEVPEDTMAAAQTEPQEEIAVEASQPAEEYQYESDFEATGGVPEEEVPVEVAPQEDIEVDHTAEITEEQHYQSEAQSVVQKQAPDEEIVVEEEAHTEEYTESPQTTVRHVEPDAEPSEEIVVEEEQDAQAIEDETQAHTQMIEDETHAETEIHTDRSAATSVATVVPAKSDAEEEESENYSESFVQESASAAAGKPPVQATQKQPQQQPKKEEEEEVEIEIEDEAADKSEVAYSQSFVQESGAQSRAQASEKQKQQKQQPKEEEEEVEVEIEDDAGDKSEATYSQSFVQESTAIAAQPAAQAAQKQQQKSKEKEEAEEEEVEIVIEDEAGEGGEKSEVSYCQSFVQESGAQVGQAAKQATRHDDDDVEIEIEDEEEEKKQEKGGKKESGGPKPSLNIPKQEENKTEEEEEIVVEEGVQEKKEQTEGEVDEEVVVVEDEEEEEEEQDTKGAKQTKEEETVSQHEASEYSADFEASSQSAAESKGRAAWSRLKAHVSPTLAAKQQQEQAEKQKQQQQEKEKEALEKKEEEEEEEKGKKEEKGKAMWGRLKASVVSGTQSPSSPEASPSQHDEGKPPQESEASHSEYSADFEASSQSAAAQTKEVVDKHTAGKEEKKEKKEKKDKKEKKEKKQHKGHHKHRHHKTEDASESVESTSEAGGEERGVKGHESEEERRSGWSKVKAHLPSMKTLASPESSKDAGTEGSNDEYSADFEASSQGGDKKKGASAVGGGMDAWMQREAAREKEREKGLGKKEERGDQKQKKAEEEERQTGKGKAGWSKLKSHVLPSPDRSQEAVSPKDTASDEYSASFEGSSPGDAADKEREDKHQKHLDKGEGQDKGGKAGWAKLKTHMSSSSLVPIQALKSQPSGRSEWRPPAQKEDRETESHDADSDSQDTQSVERRDREKQMKQEEVDTHKKGQPRDTNSAKLSPWSRLKAHVGVSSPSSLRPIQTASPTREMLLRPLDKSRPDPVRVSDSFGPGIDVQLEEHESTSEFEQSTDQ